MKFATLFSFAVFPVLAAITGTPKPEDWYTPETYRDDASWGTIYYGYDKETGRWKKSPCALNSEGDIVLPEDVEDSIQRNYELKTAIEAIRGTLKNSKQIKTIGENLNNLLLLGGIRIADNAGGGSYIVRFGDGTKSIKDVIAAKDGQGNVPATSDRKLADGLTLDWRVDNVNGKEVRSLQLKGAKDAISVDNYKNQWFRLGGDAHYLPLLRWASASPGVGELIWTNFGGFDNTAFGEVPTAKQGTHGVPLTLKGWYTNDFEHTTVTRLITEDDDGAKDLRKKLQILARKTISDQSSAPDHLTYIPIGDVLSGLGNPPDGVSIEDYVDGSSTNLAIKGWHADVRYLKPLSALITRPEDASAEPDDPEVVVVAKCHYQNGSNELAYVELGSLYGVTWATNWTEAVEHVTNTHEIVNWMTNWVYHTQYVTNYEDIVRVTTNAVYHESFITNTWNHENFITNTWNHENFITNTWNHENFITNTWNHENFITNAITQLNTIVNWQVVTNYIVRYMGGATPGAGGGKVAPPPVDPEDDPYSPEYEENPVDKYILPVKNARIINAMTNRLFSAVDPGGALDFASLYTNDAARAEISGFYLAETNQFPIKAEIAPGIYGVDWVDYPAELIQMTAGNIKQIFRWWQQHSGVTNLLANIITNHEALAEMKTNLWSHVRVDTLLDNQSTWTNGARRIEVKGFCNAPENTYPVKSIDLVSESGTILWEPVAIPDSSVVFAQETERYIFNRSLLRSDGYGKNSVTNVWSLYGFEDAKEGQVPSAHYDEDGNKELKWGSTGAALRVVGTDGTSRIVGGGAARTNTVNFASAINSNVKVSVSGNNPDEITVTIGVYYQTGSNLSGGNSGGSGL